MADTQTILFGADATPAIVAVEVVRTEPGEAVLYVRRGDKVAEIREPFAPWLLVEQVEDMASNGDSQFTELEGEGYRFLATFPGWSAFVSARESLRFKGINHVAYPSAEKQFLLSTGKTLFKGMTFDDVHRMQLDIETAGLSAQPESSRILLITLSDNRGFEAILEGDEAEILAELVKVVAERNPDVLEGHNIFGFDLPFLAARAGRCGVRLTLGRDGSEMTFGRERSCPIGGYSRPFTPAFVHGRHVVDTMLSVQRFDIPRGEIERYGLKECAQALGLSESDRVFIPGDQIAGLWATDPETVRRYAIHDVRETRRLASLVCPAEFYLTQMVPDVYQNVATTGTGEKINSILIREYLRQGRAIPKPQPSREVPGGYTEVRLTGMVRHAVKCDVESLYPSLMLTRRIKPASDVLDAFLPALEELTRRRIEAKSKAKPGSAEREERAYWDGLQASFKILINSFYGYLGAPFNFNDPDAAEKITTSGQAIVKQIAEFIEQRGGRVIEIDTDGVYFKVPDSPTTEQQEEEFIEEVGRGLPEGIHLAYDGRYAAMLSLKIKNYVLVGYDGKKTFKGASVRSRADEPFGREFISSAVDLLLKDDKEGVSRLYKDLTEKIQNHRLPVQQFARRERVTPKTFNSAQRKRMADSLKRTQGVRVGDYVTVYERNDGTLGLIEEYDGDENTEHLLDKLYKFTCRLREAFGEEFDVLFPSPGFGSRARQAEAAGQQKLELF